MSLDDKFFFNPFIFLRKRGSFFSNVILDSELKKMEIPVTMDYPTDNKKYTKNLTLQIEYFLQLIEMIMVRIEDFGFKFKFGRGFGSGFGSRFRFVFRCEF